MKQEKMEQFGTKGVYSNIFRWFWVIVFCSVLFSGLGFVTNSLGLWGQTVVERVVIKNSYQYKEGMAQQAAIWESSLVELSEQARMCNDVDTCAGIEGQKRVIRARLRAVTINQ